MMRASVAAGLIGGALCWLALALPTAESVAGLVAARQIRTNLAARLVTPPERPPQLLAPGLAITATTPAEAARGIAGRVRSRSAQAGVLVEGMRPIEAGPGLAGVAVRISGPEKAVIALIDGIERDRPLIRLRDWRATAIADGGLRVEGEMVAAWR